MIKLYIMILLSCLLTACGQKGGLYIPDVDQPKERVDE